MTGKEAILIPLKYVFFLTFNESFLFDKSANTNSLRRIYNFSLGILAINYAILAKGIISANIGYINDSEGHIVTIY